MSSKRTRIAAPDVERGCGDSAARRVQLVTRQLSSAIIAPDLESRVMVSAQIQQALAHDRTVDITTVGRRSGQPRRIEIWFHSLDGRIYISGLPGRRGWYANVVAHPDFVFHLKETAQADLPARAHPITDPAERRRVLSGLLVEDRTRGRAGRLGRSQPAHRGGTARARRRGVELSRRLDTATSAADGHRWPRRRGPSGCRAARIVPTGLQRGDPLGRPLASRPACVVGAAVSDRSREAGLAQASCVCVP